LAARQTPECVVYGVLGEKAPVNVDGADLAHSVAAGDRPGLSTVGFTAGSVRIYPKNPPGGGNAADVQPDIHRPWQLAPPPPSGRRVLARRETGRPGSAGTDGVGGVLPFSGFDRRSPRTEATVSSTSRHVGEQTRPCWAVGRGYLGRSATRPPSLAESAGRPGSHRSTALWHEVTRGDGIR